MRNICLILLSFLMLSCTEDSLPKPKGYLRLEYPKNTYKNLNLERPFQFDVSNQTVIKDLPNSWLKIEYPLLKASIDITYRPIKKNLKELLIESEKLVFKHTTKAEQIVSTNFVNDQNRVFGSVYEITGNAASQIQFHVTDSTQHFIKGALYFYVKPNYDSLLPAISYIRKDIAKIMETLEWRKSQQN